MADRNESDGGTVIRYEVVYVGDNDLPTGHSWAIVRTCVETYLFVKETEVSANLLTSIWGSWQSLGDSARARSLLLHH